MASNINPNNIDGAYPVAGQDNDSQGFRDNFTNTKNNFGYARDEISDLQAKVLLKSALTGTTLDNNMGGSLISDGRVQDFSLTRVVQTATTGSININYAAGHYHKIDALTGSITVAFSNFPTAGFTGMLRLQVVVTDTTYTMTLPSAVSINAQGTVGYSNNIITFPAAGTYEFMFVTSDGGASISMFEDNKRMAPFSSSSENLANAATVSLSVTTSYFETEGVETATLNSGVVGQIKVLVAANVAAGNMVVAVNNAGWTSSAVGNVTFSDRGQACTLQYINDRWYCIGNNGAEFGA